MPRSKRKDPATFARVYQTRLYPNQLAAVKEIVRLENLRGYCSEGRVIRGLLKLGMVRYAELGRIPEVDG